jgi:hypothetical protein
MNPKKSARDLSISTFARHRATGKLPFVPVLRDTIRDLFEYNLSDSARLLFIRLQPFLCNRAAPGFLTNEEGEAISVERLAKFWRTKSVTIECALEELIDFELIRKSDGMLYDPAMRNFLMASDYRRNVNESRKHHQNDERSRSNRKSESYSNHSTTVPNSTQANTGLPNGTGLSSSEQQIEALMVQFADQIKEWSAEFSGFDVPASVRKCIEHNLARGTEINAKRIYGWLRMQRPAKQPSVAKAKPEKKQKPAKKDKAKIMSSRSWGKMELGDRIDAEYDLAEKYLDTLSEIPSDLITADEIKQWVADRTDLDIDGDEMFHCLMGATRHKILAVYYADGTGKKDGFDLARYELVGCPNTAQYLPRLRSGECYKADCAKQDARIQECKERDRKERERLKCEEQERKEPEAREHEECERQERIERGEEEECEDIPF